MSEKAQQLIEHIFDNYMPVTALKSIVGRLLYYFQCADMHTPALSSR